MDKIISSRPPTLCENLVIVDGIPGCGKTMLSAIISSLSRVELIKYSYEIEQYLFLNYFNKLDTETSEYLINYELDLLIYNLMMSRDLNFRYTDLSSVFNSSNKFKYFKRLFSKGDEVIPDQIKLQNPILHLTTHCISAFANPLKNILTQNKILINLQRNPLYMLKQNLWNIENLINSPRDFAYYYKKDNINYPFYFFNQESKLINSNPVEKTIYFIEWLRKKAVENQMLIPKSNYYELTFESLVTNPWPHIEQICNLLNTEIGPMTHKILKREKIPRDLYTDGRDLPIYRRVNWSKGVLSSNQSESNKLYSWATSLISIEAKSSLDWLIEDYNLILQKTSLQNV